MKKILCMLLVCLLLFSGCGQLTSTPIQEEVRSEVREIDIQKAFISFTAHYYVAENNEEIGEVTGEFLPIFGDTFSYTDMEGNVIAKEYENKRLLNLSFNREAEVVDANENIVGYIGEDVVQDLFNIGYKFHFYDAEQKEIGYTQQVILSLLGEQDVYNVEGELVAKINRNFTIFTKEYTLSIYSDDIPEEQLIFFACIIDAIQTAEEEESKNEE